MTRKPKAETTDRWFLGDREPDVSGVDAEEVKLRMKAQERAPKLSDLVREFGEQGMTLKPDGSFDYALPKRDGFVDRKAQALANEMDSERVALAEKASDVARSKRRDVKLRRPDGVLVPVPEGAAGLVDRKFHARRQHRTFGYSRRYSEADYWRGR